MDTKTGDIFDAEAQKKLQQEFCRTLKEMTYDPTFEQLARKPIHKDAIGRVGRNDECPCGSGKKFKKCCWTG